jgi:hypothetical protein
LWLQFAQLALPNGFLQTLIAIKQTKSYPAGIGQPRKSAFDFSHQPGNGLFQFR